jgi:hypothetical protein
MIFDFSCREALGFLDFALPAIPGAFAVAMIIAGLALIGRLFNGRGAFQASDVFVGWGIVAGIMTLASVLFVHPLLLTAFGLFILMLGGLGLAIKDRAFVPSFWLLAFLPCLYVLVAINAEGPGGLAYDDFSHWIPNGLYVFMNDGIPSRALPAVHSIHPGYPYALPFLTYLASLLAGGFLLQGGAMINFLILFFFASMLVETANKPKEPSVSSRFFSGRALGLTMLAFIFAVFLNSTLATFGIVNQGDTGTKVLCGALALMLWKMGESLRLDGKADLKRPSLQLSLTAVAFVLLKESNLFLFFLLIFAYLAVAGRNGILKPALKKMPFILLPALAVRLIWQFYINAEIGNGNFTVLPLNLWRFDQFFVLLHGIQGEIEWKGTFIVLFFATTALGVFSLFRPQASWRDFALLAAIVQVGYAVFLFMAYLGSNFTVYEMSLGASFHRYMLHAGFLALPAFWLAAPAFWSRVKNKIRIPPVLLPPQTGILAAFISLLIMPLVISFKTDWIALRPEPAACNMENLGYRIAAALPDKAQLGVIVPQDTGIAAFIINLELALEEARTGRFLTMAWHADNYHTFDIPQPSDVQRELNVHPETNALVYSPTGYAILKILGFNDALGTDFLVRDGNKWKSAIPYPPP